MTLWYPGRPPFCTDKLICLFTHFVDSTHKLIITYDVTHLTILNSVAAAIDALITQENNECNGTDHILNALCTLLTNTLAGIHAAWQIRDFNNLFEIATNIQLICDILKEEHEKIVV